MLLLILLAIPTIVLLYQFLKAPAIRHNGRRIPHPSDTLPILGNAIRFLQPRHVLFEWFIRQQSAFNGETYEISVPSLPPGVVISSPSNVEYVLKNESLITKGEFFRSRSWDLFGYGIINATDTLWRLQRKAGLKFFSGDNLSSMVSDVLPDVFSSKTHPQLAAYSQTNEVLDLQRLFLDLTTSVVGQMAYDMEISAASPFSRAFDYASDQIGLRFQNPLYQITEIFTGVKFRAAVREVKLFGAKIVNNARKRRGMEAMESLINNSGEPTFGSLIDSLIEILGEPEVVADAAMNFLSAGRDTTAQSLTWTFYAILRNGGVLSRLLAEIERLPEWEELTMADLQPTNIPYTTAVFYESLRLYPPVPIEIKQCVQPVMLPDGTTLPEGGIVVWCIWAINRSKLLYGEDANDFRPERWLDEDEEGKGRRFEGPKSAYEFPVFNGGPRACLGKKMAEVLGAWVLVVVLREFEFGEVMEGVEGGNGVLKERVSQNSLTLPMLDGLPVRLKLRVGVGAGAVAEEKGKGGRQAQVVDEVE